MADGHTVVFAVAPAVCLAAAVATPIPEGTQASTGRSADDRPSVFDIGHERKPASEEQRGDETERGRVAPAAHVADRSSGDVRAGGARAGLPNGARPGGSDAATRTTGPQASVSGTPTPRSSRTTTPGVRTDP